MALSKRENCREATLSLQALKLFVALQQDLAEQKSEASWKRDQDFLRGAEEALFACTEESLAALLDNMRGLSHYFGSYCSDLKQFDELLDDLYFKVKEALILLRRQG